MKYTVVTGAAGFIASCLISQLNTDGNDQVIAVDDFSRSDKSGNLLGKKLVEKVHRDHFHAWLDAHAPNVQAVYHLGARTNTAEFDRKLLDALNLNYSKEVWRRCTQFGIPLVYASSAATYGLGEHGYSDDHRLIPMLKPLNPYGDTKNEFDQWVLGQKNTPPFWSGMKFFNVYGPNEYHKGRMASVILHSFRQIHDTGKVRLFRSHDARFADGMQLRDFIYVKDVTNVLAFMMENRPEPGIYNLGTGQARAFLHLAEAVFAALQLGPNIEFIDIPADIRDKYQYYTQAEMQKLREVAGYNRPFTSLEQGVSDYVSNYLSSNHYL